MPCDPGQYYNSSSGCQDCLVDTYSGGEFVTSCTSCPSGKTVSSGSGTNIVDCEWMPCDPGQYYNSSSGCQDCLVDTYSGGEFVTSCTSCPSGKTVSSGSGTNIEDCEWKPCDPGQYFDSSSGCQDCLVDTYSGGDFVTSCTSCPSGKTVSSGSGKNIEDCEWICGRGSFLEADGKCGDCKSDEFSDWGATNADNCSVTQYFYEMDISSKVQENAVHNKYRSYWRIESGLRILFVFNDQEMQNSACDMTIEIQDIELEIDVMHFRNTISDPEKLITYTLGDDENELTISALQTIMIDVKDKVRIEINEERLRFTNHGKYVVDSDAQTISITASEESCLRFLEEYSYIERLPEDDYFIQRIDEIDTVTSIPVIETPRGEVIPIELCKAAFFRDCFVVNLGFEDTWLDEDNVVKSIKIPLIPENRAIEVTSNLGILYRVQDFLVDSDLSDGQSQLGLYLETENGTSIKILKYIEYTGPGEVIKPEPLEEEGTERPPPKAVTFHRQEVTDKPIVVVPPVIEALLNNNTIFNFMTPSEEDKDESEDDDKEEETLNTFKPQLNDAVLPVKSVKVKEKEYTENREKPNLLGYFTYNGFFDIGVSKSKIKKKKNSEQVESKTEEIEEQPMNQGIDQDSFVEAIKAFQRFNGFPETGEISEKKLKL
ncbi:uncharacterized protein LOC134815500 [Bolinopsis microptera]|uniref:uncharacterized protein LOC134815500 n=1 Tax=Bolinopsis microptera TaxID=2820187 RepID=UPI00307A9A6E